jgi:hypothetical protein
MNDNDCHIWICILECDVYTILLLQVVTEKSDFSNLQVVTEKGLKVFTFKQLHSATGAFSKSNVVGPGGFRLVYRGVVNDGRKVAVKLMDRAGKQGEEEFKFEVCTFLYALDLPCYQTNKICRIWIIMIFLSPALSR